MKVSVMFITAMIIAGMILFIVLPKSDFSQNENRNLQKFPNINYENIVEGKFTEDLSSYLSDHFPFRDKFVNIKTGFEKNVLRQRLINNIYICKDGYLIEKYNKPKNIDRIINTFNKFAQNTNVKADIILAPTASAIYEDKLPKFAEKSAQYNDIEKIYNNIDLNCIDIYHPLLSQKDNSQLYYRLDHHWTTDGAYIAYAAYCNNKGIKALDKSEFNIKTVSKDFKGTVYSKLNDNSLKPDEIKIYERNMDLEVLYDGEEYNSLYAPEYLNTKDRYSYFLNNIHSVIKITNNGADNDKTLVIAKDSYANCLAPFLVNHYKYVYVFDPRSYKKSISEFANENNADDILIVYNMNTIDNDTGVNMIY